MGQHTAHTAPSSTRRRYSSYARRCCWSRRWRTFTTKLVSSAIAAGRGSRGPLSVAPCNGYLFRFPLASSRAPERSSPGTSMGRMGVFRAGSAMRKPARRSLSAASSGVRAGATRWSARALVATANHLPPGRYRLAGAMFVNGTTNGPLRSGERRPS